VADCPQGPAASRLRGHKMLVPSQARSWHQVVAFPSEGGQGMGQTVVQVLRMDKDKDMGMDPSMGMSKENLGPQSSQGGVMLAVALHVWASASAGPVAGEGVPHQEHQKHAPTRPHRLPSECGHGPSRMNATAHQQIASPVDHSESAQGGQFRPSCHELLHVLSTSDHNQSSKPQTAPRAMSPAWRSDADADLLVAWPSPGPQAYH